MKYIDNLIALGATQLFRRDTIPRPSTRRRCSTCSRERSSARVPSTSHRSCRPRSRTTELVADSALDAFGNKEVEVQLEHSADRPTLVISTDSTTESLPQLKLQYFGIPRKHRPAGLLGHRGRPAIQDTQLHEHLRRSGSGSYRCSSRRSTPPSSSGPSPPASTSAACWPTPPGADSPYRCRTLMAKALRAHQRRGQLRLGERMLAELDRQRRRRARRPAGDPNEVSLRNAITNVRQEELLAEQDAEPVHKHRYVLLINEGAGTQRFPVVEFGSGELERFVFF